MLPDVETTIINNVKSLLSKYGLQINSMKNRTYNLNISNHVRITGINITKSFNNYRHLTVGRTLKIDLFWDAIQ